MVSEMSLRESSFQIIKIYYVSCMSGKTHCCPSIGVAKTNNLPSMYATELNLITVI